MATSDPKEANSGTDATSRRRRLWHLAVVGALLATVAVACPVAWTRVASHGHVSATVTDSPTAPVVIVFGAQLAGGKPKPMLAGRLSTTVELVRQGRASVVLVSGDGDGESGNEITAMTRYLVEHGVDPRRIVGDPYGLDTYDTCVRAARVYQVSRALLVSQSFHLPRAVTLCREAGIDATGVPARCDGCQWFTLLRNWVRETFACSKAAFDVGTGSDPAVESPPHPGVADALRD